MKTVTFCFDHPVAVKVFFNCLFDPEIKHEILFLRSDDGGCIQIPTENLAEGTWRLMLEWGHDGRDFCMEKTIEVPAKILD